jgi:hypothetical protein
MATRSKKAAKKPKKKATAAKRKASPPKKKPGALKARAAKPAKKPAKAKAKAKARAAKKPRAKVTKKSPARVAKAAPKAAPKVTLKVAPKVTKAAKAGAKKAYATYLGRADSMNASISLLLVDGAAAAEAWKGIDPDDFEAIEKTASRLGSLVDDLDSGKAQSFELGGGTGLGFQLSVGKGIAHVFRAQNRVVIAEGFVDDVETPDFLKWVASPPAKEAADGGTLDANSGVIAMLLPGGAYEDLPSRLTQSIDEARAARIGSDSPGLLVKVAAKRYRLLVEPETSGSFGQAARAVLEPA